MQQARAALTTLEHGISLSPASVRSHGRSYLLAGGLLPGHPVRLSIDGHLVTTLTATSLGTVTYLTEPSLLKLAAGPHVVRLGSMLITMTATLRTH